MDSTSPLARRVREPERENAELRSRAGLFQQLVESDLEVHPVVDSGGIILYMSPSAEQVLGYRRQLAPHGGGREIRHHHRHGLAPGPVAGPIPPDPDLR